MATVPAPRTWGASEQVTAAKLNADIRDSFNFYLSPPRAVLRMVALQNIPTNSETALIWDAEDIDTDGGHSLVTNPSRYTAQTAGWYFLSATIKWAQVGPGVGMIEAVLRKNGASAGRQGRSDQFPHSTEAAAYVTAGHMQLAVGDYVEVTVYQESGAVEEIGTLFGAVPYRRTPRFEIRWVRS